MKIFAPQMIGDAHVKERLDGQRVYVLAGLARKALGRALFHDEPAILRQILGRGEPMDDLRCFAKRNVGEYFEWAAVG